MEHDLSKATTACLDSIILSPRRQRFPAGQTRFRLSDSTHAFFFRPFRYWDTQLVGEPKLFLFYLSLTTAGDSTLCGAKKPANVFGGLHK